MVRRCPPPLALFLLLAGLGQMDGQGPPSPRAVPVQIQLRAGLQVAPTRVVFDNRRRSAIVNLINDGAAQGHYRIGLEHLEMDENGAYHELPLEHTPGQAALQDMFHFAPRDVILNPSETQAVRIQVRKPSDLPPGEYRLHLAFQEVPPAPGEPGAETVGDAPRNTTMATLVATLGVSIPVIFRNGTTSANATVSGLALTAEGKELLLRLGRTGNQSIYGDILATFQPRSGQPQVLFRGKGVSVYPPNAYRNIRLPLGSSPISGAGRIQVTYSAPSEDGGAVLAEGSLEIR